MEGKWRLLGVYIHSKTARLAVSHVGSWLTHDLLEL